MRIGTNGKLELPLRNEILEIVGQKYIGKIDKMWSAMWQTYIRNKGTTATPYWATKINNVIVVNKTLKILSEAGWIKVNTKPERNWSDIQINEDKLLQHFTSTHLENIRAYNKFSKYMLTDSMPKVSNLTKINGDTRNTGLIRNGFYRTGETPFQFDTLKLQEYLEPVKLESIKSMSKIRDMMKDLGRELDRDKASYDEVISIVLDNIMNSKGTYRSGQAKSDSRGRNIAGYLNKIFNPVSFKVSRALMVIPEDRRNIATTKGLRNKYLFIAEILGFKNGTVQEKVDAGREHYYNHKLLNLNWDRTNEINKINACESFSDKTKRKLIKEQVKAGEDDRAEVFENIWLERTYEDIDNFLKPSMKARFMRSQFQEGRCNLDECKASMESNPVEYRWVVPIEIDMSALTL